MRVASLVNQRTRTTSLQIPENSQTGYFTPAIWEQRILAQKHDEEQNNSQRPLAGTYTITEGVARLTDAIAIMLI
jgi:hypothetical protein